MTNISKISIALAAIVGVGAASVLIAQSPKRTQTDAPDVREESRQVPSPAPVPVPAPSAAEKESPLDSSPVGGVTADKPATATVQEVGRYEPYSKEKLALAEHGDVVLFFKASWCPTCRALDADLRDRQKEIPGTLSVLTLDYDTETDLKKKYGVTTQHTLVRVDANGNLLKKWSGGGTLESILAEL